MNEVIEVTHLYCPKSGSSEGEANSTHHLVPKGTATSRSMTCTYCGKAEKQLRDEAS